MSMYRGVVTNIDTAGLWVRIAEQGVVGPLPWTGQPPAVGGSVLVADAGQPGQPDLIVLGTVPGTAATGWVTSAMIANATIVDADVNASAAIAQTKIAGMGAWTTYNPSWNNVSMSATDAAYCQLGKLVAFRCIGTLSDAPSGAVTVGMPVNMASAGAQGTARLLRGANYQGVWLYNSASTALVRYLDDANLWQNLSATLPAAWASGDKITLTGTYEAA